jgi:hypothetical protein
MSRLYAASTLLFLLPHGLTVPVGQDLPSFQLLNATYPAAAEPPTSIGYATAFATSAPLREPALEPLDVSLLTRSVSASTDISEALISLDPTFGQPVSIEPGIGDGTGPEAYSIPPAPEAPKPQLAGPHTLSVHDLASIVQQIANVISTFFAVVPETTTSLAPVDDTSFLKSRQLSGLSGNALGGLVQTLLNLMTELLEKVPVVGVVASKLPLASTTGVLRGLGKDKRDVPGLPIGVVTDLVQTVLGLLESVLNSLPNVGGVENNTPFGTPTNALGRLSKRSTLTAPQQKLFDIAIAKNAELKQTLEDLKAAQQSHLQSEKRQLQGFDLTSLLSTVTSLLDTVLSMTKSLPVTGTVADTLPLGEASGVTGSLGTFGAGIGGSVGKRQLPSTDVAASLLPTVLGLLDTVLNIFKNSPGIDGVVGKLPVSSLGGRAEKQPHITDADTPTPPTLKSLLKMFLGLTKGTPVAEELTNILLINTTSVASWTKSSLGGQSKKRQVPNLDVATSLLTVVTDLLHKIVKLASTLPVAGSVAGTVTSKLSGNPVSLITGTLGSFGARSGPLRARQVLNNFGGLGGLSNIVKPATDATKPLVQMTKPLTTAAYPVVAAAQPVAAVTKSALDVAAPALDVALPTLNAAAPAVEITKPVVGAASPVLDAAGPAIDVAEPVLDAAAPITEVAKTVLPLDLLQTLIKLVVTFLSLDLGSVTAPLTTRSELVSEVPSRS